jgi:hypothetical protein
VELSVDVHAPVVVGVYPMRIARYLADGNGVNGTAAPAMNGAGAHPQSDEDGLQPGSEPRAEPLVHATESDLHAD